MAQQVEPTPIRVLIADDHPVIRAGIRAGLECARDVAVVAEAGTAEEAIRQSCTLRLDVVVIGVEFPDGSGLEACRQITSCCTQVAVVVFTAFDSDAYLAHAWAAGAAGLVNKDADMCEVVAAIRQAGGRKRLWTPVQMQRVRTWQQTVGARLKNLTPRERQVLRHVAVRESNREIAEALSLSEKTVENYVCRILDKVGFASRMDVATWAEQNGLTRLWPWRSLNGAPLQHD